jgi:hypothetical protein
MSQHSNFLNYLSNIDYWTYTEAIDSVPKYITKKSRVAEELRQWCLYCIKLTFNTKTRPPSIGKERRVRFIPYTLAIQKIKPVSPVFTGDIRVYSDVELEADYKLNIIKQAEKMEKKLKEGLDFFVNSHISRGREPEVKYNYSDTTTDDENYQELINNYIKKKENKEIKFWRIISDDSEINKKEFVITCEYTYKNKKTRYQCNERHKFIGKPVVENRQVLKDFSVLMNHTNAFDNWQHGKSKYVLKLSKPIKDELLGDITGVIIFSRLVGYEQTVEWLYIFSMDLKIKKTVEEIHLVDEIVKPRKRVIKEVTMPDRNYKKEYDKYKNDLEKVREIISEKDKWQKVKMGCRKYEKVKLQEIVSVNRFAPLQYSYKCDKLLRKQASEHAIRNRNEVVTYTPDLGRRAVNRLKNDEKMRKLSKQEQIDGMSKRNPKVLINCRDEKTFDKYKLIRDSIMTLKNNKDLHKLNENLINKVFTAGFLNKGELHLKKKLRKEIQNKIHNVFEDMKHRSLVIYSK